MVSLLKKIERGNEKIKICKKRKKFMMNIENGEIIWESGKEIKYKEREVIEKYCIKGRIENGWMDEKIIRKEKRKRNWIS